MNPSLKYKKRHKTGQKTISVTFAIAVAAISLILSGYFYQKLENYLTNVTAGPIKLSTPLSEIPMQIGQWRGKDVPIALEILRVAKNDDYINRIYSVPEKRLYVNLYIAFSATPRTMLGHRPRVCYRGAGWIHDQTEEVLLETKNNRMIPALVHKFHKDFDEVFVLNFYILNGKITNSEKGFSGINLRTPNIDGELAKYVAQVQISGKYRADVESAARSLVDTVMNFFPDINKDRNKLTHR